MDGGQIGRSLLRLEDPRFLTGQGRYVEASIQHEKTLRAGPLSARIVDLLSEGSAR